MIWDTKKFKRELSALKQLSGRDNLLTAEEFLAVKRKILTAIADAPRPQAIKTSRLQRLGAVLRQAAPILLGLSLIGGTALAANTAKPGELLYPVKLATEKIRLNLASSDQSKANLKALFAIERLKELREIAPRMKSPRAIQNNSVIGRPQTGLLNSSGTLRTILLPSAGSSNESDIEPKDKQRRIQIQARAEARLEVNSALDALQKVKVRLQTTGDNGDNKAADEIANNILNLRAQAKTQDVFIDRDSSDSPAEVRGGSQTPAAMPSRSEDEAGGGGEKSKLENYLKLKQENP